MAVCRYLSSITDSALRNKSISSGYLRVILCLVRNILQRTFCITSTVRSILQLAADQENGLGIAIKSPFLFLMSIPKRALDFALVDGWRKKVKGHPYLALPAFLTSPKSSWQKVQMAGS